MLKKIVWFVFNVITIYGNDNMDLSIKKATAGDFEKLHSILVSCGEDMYKRLGLNHWYPYDDLNKFQAKVKYANVYCVYSKDQMIGTFNLNENPRAYYKLSMWSNPEAKAVYLGQLAILPEFQGKGLGVWCMQQIENIVQEMGCEIIRFDCIERHPRLVKFYENAGYQRKCIVNMPEPIGNLVCFEKIINKN